MTTPVNYKPCSTKKFELRKTTIYTLLCGLLASGGVISQDLAAQEASTILEEIIVTAQRREQTLQEVPLAISAFTSSELDSRQVTNTLDLVKYVPSTIGHNNTGLGSANVYFIRGLGNTESIATFDPPVATYVDEIYVARQNANNYSLFDVERIEVLRGPQGTLFGRNTTGGAISIVNKRPSDEFGGYLEVGAGSFGRFQARGGVDIPFSDNFRTKISAFVVDDDGWSDNLVTGEELNGEDSLGIRAAATWALSDNVEWDFSIDYIDSEKANIAASTPTLRGFDLFSRANLPTPIEENTSRVNLLNQDCDGDVVPGALAEAAVAGAPTTGNCNRTETIAFTSNIAWQISENWSANFITGFRDLTQNFVIDFIDGVAGGFILANDGDHDQFTQEIKFSGSLLDGRLNLVAGLFHFEEDNETRLVDFFFGAFDRNIENDTTSTAAYIQGDYQLSDRWTLTAGVRYTDEEKDINYTGGLTSAEILAAGNPLLIEDDEVTPRFALAYQASDNINYFISATRGFKSGGVNARGSSGFEILPFGPETAWNFELGTRMELWNNRLRLNATLFRMEVDDLQVITGINRPEGGIAFLTQNSADLEVTGLEVETTATLSDNFDVFFNFNLTDAEYASVNDISGTISTDTTPVRSPDSQFSVGGRYTIPTQSGAFFINADLSWTDEFQTATNNEASSLDALSEGGALVNAGIGYRGLDNKWSVSLECKNCFEEQYVTSWFFPLYVNEPRRVLARFSYNF